MVGHGLLAFALVASAAAALGWSGDRALVVGAAAAAFAVVPDADMVYALYGLATANYSGVFAVTNAFWGASTQVHRSATHSLVVGTPAALAFALWTVDGDRRRAARAVAVVLLGGLVAAASLASGALDAAVIGVFGAAGVGVATLVDRLTDLPFRVTLAAALAGLLTHPFGDVFTGTPPLLFYPLDVGVIASRVAFSPDPTVHLLAVFGLEVATVWLAAAVYLRVTGGPALRDLLGPRAALGVCYAPAALVLAPPTLDVSYHFVFSVLAVGAALATPTIRRAPGALYRTATVLARRDRPAEPDGGTVEDRWTAGVASFGALLGVGPDADAVLGWALTGTAAVTLAWAGFLAIYLLE